MLVTCYGFSSLITRSTRHCMHLLSNLDRFSPRRRSCSPAMLSRARCLHTRRPGPPACASLCGPLPMVTRPRPSRSRQGARCGLRYCRLTLVLQLATAMRTAAKATVARRSSWISVWVWESVRSEYRPPRLRRPIPSSLCVWLYAASATPVPPAVCSKVLVTGGEEIGRGRYYLNVPKKGDRRCKGPADRAIGRQFNHGHWDHRDSTSGGGLLSDEP